MSVSFMWELVKPKDPRSFRAGTSSDIGPLKETFGDVVSTKDIPTLRAMHRSTHLAASLWSEMADALESLQGEEDEISIRVWTEF